LVRSFRLWRIREYMITLSFYSPLIMVTCNKITIYGERVCLMKVPLIFPCLLRDLASSKWPLMRLLSFVMFSLLSMT
jgi:hypothetical protein